MQNVFVPNMAFYALQRAHCGSRTQLRPIFPAGAAYAGFAAPQFFALFHRGVTRCRQRRAQKKGIARIFRTIPCAMSRSVLSCPSQPTASAGVACDGVASAAGAIATAFICGGSDMVEIPVV